MDGSQRRVLISLSSKSWANGLTIDPVGKLQYIHGLFPLYNTRLVIPAVLTDSYPNREPGANGIDFKRSGLTNMYVIKSMVIGYLQPN